MVVRKEEKVSPNFFALRNVIGLGLPSPAITDVSRSIRKSQEFVSKLRPY